MNNQSKKTDEMLRAYFSRKQEEFVFEERKKSSVKIPALISLALVLLASVSIIAYSCFKPKNEVFITVSSANMSIATAATPDSPQNDYGTYGTSDNTHIYTSDHPPVVSHKVEIISFSGENILNVKVSSQNAETSFCWLNNKLMEGVEIDAEIDIFAYESNIYGYEYYQDSYEYIISTAEDGSLVLGYINPYHQNDSIKTIVTFEDGTHAVRYLDIAYIGEEIEVAERCAEDMP